MNKNHYSAPGMKKGGFILAETPTLEIRTPIRNS